MAYLLKKPGHFKLNLQGGLCSFVLRRSVLELAGQQVWEQLDGEWEKELGPRDNDKNRERNDPEEVTQRAHKLKST